jgi:hypothetical protein
MGQLITDVINIPELIGYVRESAVINGPNLAGIIPPVLVDDLEFELRNLDIPLVQVAKYRAWDTPPPLGKRAGFSTIKGEILPLGLSLHLNEKEVARLDALRQGLASTALDDIYDDARQCAEACAVRFEIARADLLLDGKVTINENGVNAVEANFGIPGGHIVSAGTAWTDHANSTPITNLRAWQSTYRAANGGRNPDFWLASSDVIADLTLNSEVRTLTPVTGVVPGIITPGTMGQVLLAAGVAPIVAFDGMVPDPTTFAETRTINARKLIGLRRGVAQLLYGVHPVVGQLNRAGARLERTDAAGIVAYVEEQVRPVAVTTTAEAVGLPVLRDPKALFIATV